jgi:hypothetical protein
MGESLKKWLKCMADRECWRCGNNDISEHHDRNDLEEVERRGGKRKKGVGSRVLNNSKWNRGGLIC